jgi:hypothetical protein
MTTDKEQAKQFLTDLFAIVRGVVENGVGGRWGDPMLPDKLDELANKLVALVRTPAEGT